MSDVTNIIVSFSITEDQDDRLRDLNRFLNSDPPEGEGYRGWHHDPSPLVMTSDVAHACGGTKNMERPTAMGSYNFLDVDRFIEHVRGISWTHPELVQVFACGQEDEIYREVMRGPVVVRP